jgi:hypothetical protein
VVMDAGSLAAYADSVGLWKRIKLVKNRTRIMPISDAAYRK